MTRDTARKTREDKAAREAWQDVAQHRLELASKSIASAHECVGNVLHREVAGDAEYRKLALAFDALTAVRLELIRIHASLGGES